MVLDKERDLCGLLCPFLPSPAQPSLCPQIHGQLSFSYIPLSPTLLQSLGFPLLSPCFLKVCLIILIPLSLTGTLPSGHQTATCTTQDSGVSGPSYPEPSCSVFTLPSVTSILLGPPKGNLSLCGFLGPRPSDSKSLDADCCLPDPPAVDCQVLEGRDGFSLKFDPPFQ